MSTDCVFCEIVAGKAPASVVYEDDLALAFMDIRPVTPGHTLVIPKPHHACLSEVPEPIWAHICVVARKIGQAVRSSVLRCEGVNIYLADGEAAGQEVFHCHLHVIPRFEGDGFRIGASKAGRPSRNELDDIARMIAGAHSGEQAS